MARQSTVQSARPQLTQEELAEGFTRLVSDQWRLGDADPFIKRVKAVPSVSAPYLVHHLVSGGPKEREVATVLLRLLAGPRVIVPLREALKDASLPDEARIAAILVLQGMGEPVSMDAAAKGMHDPAGLFESIWETVMDRSEDDESFLEGLLLGMEEAPAPERDEVVRSLAEPRDARAVRLLRPLLFSKRSSTVLAAIEAIEAVRGLDALDAVKDVSEHDPSATVRKRARVAYGRLFMQSGAQLPGFETVDMRPQQVAGAQQEKKGTWGASAPSEKELPVVRTWVTLLDGKGHQGVVVARRRGNGLLKVLTVIVGDTEGIRRCMGADAVREEELADIEAQLRSEGLAPVEASIETCRRAVDEGRRLHLALQQHRLPMEMEIWRGMLGVPPKARELPADTASSWNAARQDATLMALVPETGRLMALPEFQRWVFEAGLVWPYVDEWMRASAERSEGGGSLTGEEALNRIVSAACRDLFNPSGRRVWSRRLQRQALLLEQLGKTETARLATAAAVGLDLAGGVPSDLHPFARAMVMASLYAAGLRTRQGWA